MHPLFFVAFGIVWLLLVVVVFAMCRVAARADEQLERIAWERDRAQR